MWFGDISMNQKKPTTVKETEMYEWKNQRKIRSYPFDIVETSFFSSSKVIIWFRSDLTLLKMSTQRNISFRTKYLWGKTKVSFPVAKWLYVSNAEGRSLAGDGTGLVQNSLLGLKISHLIGLKKYKN